MNNLRKWVRALTDWVLKTLENLEPGMYEKMKKKIETYWKTWEAPVLDEQGNLTNPLRDPEPKQRQREKNADTDEDEDEAELEFRVKLEAQLPENVLKVNLGVPILICINKSDFLLNGNLKHLLEENFDFIQKHVRQYALQYGASVIFTSASQKKNLDVWYQYIVHRLYNSDNIFGPVVHESDTLFIPAGFDSMNLIEELTKGTVLVGSDGSEQIYEDVIQPQQAQGSAKRLVKQANQVLECADWNLQLAKRYEELKNFKEY